MSPEELIHKALTQNSSVFATYKKSDVLTVVNNLNLPFAQFTKVEALTDSMLGVYPDKYYVTVVDLETNTVHTCNASVFVKE